MKHAGKLRMTLLTCAAAALVLGSSVGTSMSYFTTYVTAKGSKTVAVERTIPHVDEKLEGSIKQVTIRNNGDRDCYVRVKVFAPVECTYENSEKWQHAADGYWYYSDVLAPGASTEMLRITPVPDKRDQDYDIIVVAESAPIIYVTDETSGETVLHANGPAYEGWNLEGVQNAQPEP